MTADFPERRDLLTAAVLVFLGVVCPAVLARLILGWLS